MSRSPIPALTQLTKSTNWSFSRRLPQRCLQQQRRHLQSCSASRSKRLNHQLNYSVQVKSTWNDLFAVTLLSFQAVLRSSSFPRTYSTIPSHSSSVSSVLPHPPLRSSIPPTTYDLAYIESLKNPEEFWRKAASPLKWRKKKGPVLTFNSNIPHEYEWFKDWELNTCENALDVHVESGRGEQVAIIYDSAVTNRIEKFTYNQILKETSRLAGAISCGIEAGDRVLIYLPMIPEAIISMLACARIGAIHSVVFGGFGAVELAKRISDCEPKLIITASCGIETKRVIQYKPLLDEAIELSKINVPTVVVVQREQWKCNLIEKRDIEWNEFLNKRGKPTDPVSLPGSHPLYLLYTSGTTGQPKGVLRPSGGHAVVMRWTMEYLFGQKPGSIWWAASDIGWVVGHSYIVYAPLLHGLTSILYEGKPVGTPDASAFWRVISQHQVEALFTAPTALRAIKKEDDQGKGIEKYKIRGGSLKRLWVAGERGDPATVEWGQRLLGVPVLDNYWQTESGFPIIASPFGLHPYPVKPGSATKPLPGYNLHLLSDTGEPITTPNTEGNLALKYPLPPCCLTTLYKNHGRYVSSYTERFPGYYDTSDSGHIDEDGYVHIMARTDDVMNVAGHRLSSGAMEEAVGGVKGVAECAVVGLPDSVKGQVPIAFVVLRTGEGQQLDELEKIIVAAVRHSIGPVASLKHVWFVPRLPKTRSGKILRGAIRQLAEGIPVKVPPTIEDETVLTELKDLIQKKKTTL